MCLNVMKLLAVCLLVACTGDASPTRRVLDISASAPADTNNLITPDTDVEAAIKEVEDLIKTDSTLPRLTRGEILDIIDNITKSDAQKLNHTRDQKAVMLVLPYSPNSAHSGDIQDLYTKPPITKIIGESQIDYKKQRSPPKKLASTTVKPITSTTVKATTTAKFLIMEEFETFPSSQPVITTKKPTTTTMAFKPLRRRVTTKAPQTERHPNHKYPEEDVFVVKSTPVFATTSKPYSRPISNEGLKIIPPPKFHQIPDKIKLEPQYKPVDDLVKFHQIPDKIKLEPQYKPAVDITKHHQKPEPQYKPNKPKPTKLKPTSAPESIMSDMNLPDDFKQVLKNLDVLIKEDPKYSSQYESLSPLAMKPPMSQNSVKQMLAAIGPQPTTTTALPDMQQVANNLSPDMKNLLMSFGLIPDPNKPNIKPQEEVTYIEPTSDVNPDSYSSFKPLPSVSTANSQDGMDELLAQYGLGARSQKSISMKKPPQINSFDAVPDDLKAVLTDIGLTNKHVTDLNAAKKEKPQHVFSPADNQFATIDEINKLNQLAGVIKQLEKLNGTATEEDLKGIDLDGLKELVGSLNVPLDEQIGPNPLDFDNSFEKNEVKRQQSTTTTTTEVSAKNPSIAALEESFGGASDTVTEVVVPVTEAPKKTGFYYLVDWNTFLDIDNQKGKRVNLRFQPTIGDPSRFLSVNVP